MPAASADVRTVLVYSSSDRVRASITSALGTRPAPGLELSFVEASTAADVVDRCDVGGIDLAILDGEAAPAGGLGVCRQLKAELDDPPPVLVVVGRRDDAWLATWSRADGVVSHPLDPVKLAATAVGLLSAGVVAPLH